MTPCALSITGVACSVLEQFGLAAWGGLRSLGNVLRQTTAPLPASKADKESSIPTVNTKSRFPWPVATPVATKGEVRLAIATSLVATGSLVSHNSFNRDTVLGDSVFSVRFQPLRCPS